MKNTDQHPPLPVPPMWNQQERMFIIQLEMLIDALYKKTGELDRRLTALEDEE